MDRAVAHLDITVTSIALPYTRELNITDTTIPVPLNMYDPDQPTDTPTDIESKSQFSEVDSDT